MNNKLKSAGMMSYHLVGIGGIGMSAIAQLLQAQGRTVSGSDRNNDRRLFPHLFSALEHQGIKLFSQDGSGVNGSTNCLVVSSAIEDNNPDVKEAREKGITIIKRADLLAEIFNNLYGIAIGGTNGKTTVSGMIGWILDYAGLDPTILIGGYIKNYATNTFLGNTKVGKSTLMTIEADESDGSIIGYRPKVGVITNISKDHKPVDELSQLFSSFIKNTTETLVINADCPELRNISLRSKNVVTYGSSPDAKIRIKDVVCPPHGSRFKANGTTFELNIQGLYNVSNAAAAISVAKSLGISDDKIFAALKSFKGISRRMDLIGEVNGIKIIDDFAHNPAKIMAAIDAARLSAERLIVVFQPHGYGPTNFLKEELIAAFKAKLSSSDMLFMPEIFYAGGTANKNISSSDIINRLYQDGINAFYVPERNDIVDEISKALKGQTLGNGQVTTTVIVMGARDDTLTTFCHEILKRLKD
ncbi:MAG TPA: UDP-N-acetylmuramate--L-alanine ligase [Candidatus Brocadiia bacterium]|nr:UDP-N-acetylmuramate--L-alanine ligase [Candidatus Brocadiales bacterium]